MHSVQIVRCSMMIFTIVMAFFTTTLLVKRHRAQEVFPLTVRNGQLTVQVRYCSQALLRMLQDVSFIMKTA